MRNFKIFIATITVLFLLSCNQNKKSADNQKLQIVTTTTMITDIIKEIGGDKVQVNGLMGAGVDPHLYKASEGDVHKLFKADIIFYSGLHLEGKLTDIFEKMEKQGSKIYPLSNALDKSQLISSANFASNYDPHIWFDLNNWRVASKYIAAKIKEEDPQNALVYDQNLKALLSKFDSTENLIFSKINELPDNKRILITAHDAFNYFGKAYGFEVLGLQGISTATEAGVKDVQNLANYIVDHKIKAIFVESSVPKRNIEALQESVKSKGFDVKIGGELYSDALGSEGTVEGTYLGMFEYNVNTIVNALK